MILSSCVRFAHPIPLPCVLPRRRLPSIFLISCQSLRLESSLPSQPAPRTKHLSHHPLLAEPSLQMPPTHPQDEVQHHSLSDPASFWAEQASHLHWHKQPSKPLSNTTKTLESGVQHNHWEWFPEGEISTCYNCVDRHVLAGNGDQTAIIFDSPVTNTKQKFTYQQLLKEVETFAGVLREEGVKKGDVVLMYMPMIPAALIGALAISRLGAIHTVVFGGFAPASLAQRIEASKPAAILTASCGIDGAKPPIPYGPLVTEAIERSSFKPEKTIIWQRDQLRWNNFDKMAGNRNWQRLVKSAEWRGVKADCVPVKSTDGVYVIYTSGTTGLPKGVVREAGGHAVGLHLSISYLFGIHGPGDVMLPFDGLIVIVESVGERVQGEHWAKNGVDVCIYLEEGAMRRLVADKELRG